MVDDDASADTLQLLQTFLHVAEANKGTPADSDERVLDAEGVGAKCLHHAISTLYLNRSTTVPELSASFFDGASMSVLARAAFESFLVFEYVFALPKTDADREFRHLSWILADLIERQGFPATLEETRETQKREREVIASIRLRLQRNPEFRKLSSKEQVDLLSGKKWRLKSWTQIAAQAGLGKLHAQHAYRYLCSHAHSGSLSTVQVRTAKTRTDQLLIASLALKLINVTLAFMIESYCELFPKSQLVLDRHPAFKCRIEFWKGFGTKA